MLYKITEKWADAWKAFLLSIESVLELALSEWITDIGDIQINKLLKGKKYIDENNVEYTDAEQKKMNKTLIHLFVWINNYAETIWWTNSIVQILKKIRKTIKKLEGIKDAL